MKIIFTFLLVLFFFPGLNAQSECTVKILYSMNKSQPPSYTFKVDPVTDGSKYYWSFGDKTNSDSPSPTHIFRVSDTYQVQVKVVASDGKSCYGEVKTRFEGGTTVTTPAIVSGKGKVKKPDSTDGCRLLIYLENGSVLAPVEVVPAFEFKDGQFVEMVYEIQKEKPSGCTSGVSVKIHRIAEIIVPTVCKVPVNFKKNEGKPGSYTFSTTEQAADSKYNWYFGDGGMSDMATPTYVFKKAGTWEIKLKVIDRNGKVCYGETKATFEGETVVSPTILSGKGKVKMPGSNDGCKLSIYLENGDVIIPIEMVPNFEFKDGQYIELAYEIQKEKPSGCNSGVSAKIYKIAEIIVPTVCKVPVNFKKSEGKPVSYTFSTTEQAADSKYNWYFGDGGMSDLATPTYVFKKAGTWEIKLKVIDRNGKVCYGETKATFEGETVVSPTILSGKGKVKMPGSNDGCKLSIYLENGDVIIPIEMIPNFEFKDGQYIELAYELQKEKPSGCTSGVSAKIYKIAEIIIPTVCKVQVNIKKNEGKPGSYTFSTTEQPADSKYNWYFGDGGMSDLATPTYVFKRAGTWEIKLKVIDKAGKVCYGETKATFEGETNPPLSARGKVKKLDVAGCDLVIALDNAILIPAKIATDFQLREGQYVEFTFEKYAEKVTSCKEGTDVKILTIKEIQTTPVCKFELVVKPKEASPKTFLFYAVSQADIKTWKWSFGDGKGSELENPENEYEKTGVYEVSCTITTAAGCTETRIVKHTVLPAPLASCAGAISLLLYDATDKCNGKATVKLLDENAMEINGVNYLWSDGRIGSTVENLCPDKPYSVHAIIEGVCQKNTSFTMMSKPAWRVTTANGQSNFSVISPKEGIAYEWDFGNGMVIKGTDINYNFENDGIYNVTLKAVSGGDFSENTQQIEVLKSVTSIRNIEKPQLEVYPNPVKNILKINFGNPVEGTIHIEIMNIDGQRTYSQQITTDGFSQTAINVQHLKPGIYFLRVINGSKPFADRKFIKAD